MRQLSWHIACPYFAVSSGAGSTVCSWAKGPRRAATKAAREPDRSVVVLREDRQAERQRTWPRWIGPSTFKHYCVSSGVRGIRARCAAAKP